MVSNRIESVKISVDDEKLGHAPDEPHCLHVQGRFTTDILLFNLPSTHDRPRYLKKVSFIGMDLRQMFISDQNKYIYLISIDVCIGNCEWTFIFCKLVPTIKKKRWLLIVKTNVKGALCLMFKFNYCELLKHKIFKHFGLSN